MKVNEQNIKTIGNFLKGIVSPEGIEVLTTNFAHERQQVRFSKKWGGGDVIAVTAHRVQKLYGPYRPPIAGNGPFDVH